MANEKALNLNRIHWSALPLLGCLMLVLNGCSSARVTNTWRDPGFAGPIQFKKTVALAIHSDNTVRRVAEDEVARQMGPQHGVAAYTFLDEDDRQDLDRLKSKLQS